MRHAAALAAGVASAALLTGCSSIDYYVQAVHGQFALLAAARPIPDWLADPATPDDLKRRLELARSIRAFASEVLAEPDNRSYTSYADLKRPAAVWNVFATGPLSLTLKTWCYPLFGCAGYRGYFDQRAADALGAALAAQGLDVAVAPIPAYSTLGWFNDPLLNTFIRWPDAELARLVFHELAHQIVYVKDDTVFNESFATAVEREGVRRWLAARGDPAQRLAYAQFERRRSDYIALLLDYRARLAAAYAADDQDWAATRDRAATRDPAATPHSGAAPADGAPAAPDSAQLGRKRAIFAQLQADYRALRDQRWGGYAGYDHYFAQDLNNAHLAAVGAYYDDVPAFETLLAQQQGDLPAFYRAVRRLAALPPAARTAALQREPSLQ